MTSILITTQDHLTDAVQTKSLKVNPAAATGRLKTWAQMGVNLSKDSYVKTVRIDETDCDEQKTPLEITNVAIGGQSFNVVDGVCNVNLTTSQVVSNGSISMVIGGVFVSYLNEVPVWTSDDSEVRSFTVSRAGTGTGNNNRLTLVVFFTAGRVAQSNSAHLLIPASETYDEDHIQFNFTITEG